MRRRASGLTPAQFLDEYPRIAGAEELTEQEREQQRQQEEARQEDERRQQEQARQEDERRQQEQEREQAPEPREDPSKVSVSKAELDALRRKVAEGEKAKRKAETETKQREEQRQREQGEYQKLAETKEREAVEAQSRLARLERDQRVARIATRLKFRDPQDVVDRLTNDEAEDDSLAEEALTRIAKAKPYLVDKQPDRPQIGQVMEPGVTPEKGGAKAPLTMEQVDRMTAEEIADRWDEVALVIKSEREKQTTSRT